MDFVPDLSSPVEDDELPPVPETALQPTSAAPEAPSSLPLDFVKELEGWNPNAYGDFKQYSIGWGTRARNRAEVIDEAEGERRLAAELTGHAKRVDDAAASYGLTLTPGQRDALVSFDFNTGKAPDVMSSKDPRAIANRMVQYNKAGGKLLPGLVTRRKAEIDRFWQDTSDASTGQGDTDEGFVPDLANPIDEPFVPDLSSPEEPPAIVADEALKATAGAVQALDVMGAPLKLDWSDIQNERDAQRYTEAQTFRAMAKIAEENGSGTGPGSEAFTLRRRADAVEAEILPHTEAGKRMAATGAGQLQAIEQAATTQEREAAVTPYGALSSFMGPALTDQAGAIAEGAARNAGPAAGGLLAAARFTPAAPAAAAAPIASTIFSTVAAMMGGMAGAQGQEGLLQSTETPEETQARGERTAETEAQYPIGSRIGMAAASLPVFKPSVGEIYKALKGNPEALRNVATAAGVGAGASLGANAVAKEPANIAEAVVSALENMLMNNPTRLGRALGFHPPAAPASETPPIPIASSGGGGGGGGEPARTSISEVITPAPDRTSIDEVIKRNQPAPEPPTPSPAEAAPEPPARTPEPAPDPARAAIEAEAQKVGPIRYDGDTQMGDDGFYYFSDTTSKPGTTISFTVESKGPPSAEAIAAKHAERLAAFGVELPKPPSENQQENIPENIPAPPAESFKWKFPSDDFGSESTPVAFAVMDMGGVLSKTAAKKAKRFAGNEDLWSGQFTAEHPTHNKVFKVNGQAPDKVAQALYEANLIPEPTPEAMWRALQKESTSSRNAKLEQGRQEMAELATKKQAADFEKTAADPKSGSVVSVSDLAVGDTVTVGSETLKVTEVSPEGDVILEDGKRFGVQEVKDGEVLYGQHEKAEQTPPEDDPFKVDDEPAPPPGPKTTTEGPIGIRNAVTGALRKELGLPERVTPELRDFDTLHTEATEALKADPEAGNRLVSQLENAPGMMLSDTQDAIATFELNRRRMARNEASRRVNEAKTPEEREAAMEDFTRLDDATIKMIGLLERTGTESARGLNARRLMLNADYSLSRMLENTRTIRNGGEKLSPEQVKEVTELHAKIADLEKRILEKETGEAAAAARKTFDQVLRQTQKEAKSAAKSKKSIVDFLTEKEAEAKKRIVERRGKLLSTIDPLNIAGLVDEAIIGAAHIARGIRDKAAWVKQMLADFGARIKPALDGLWDKSNELHAGYETEFKAANKAKTPQEILEKLDPDKAPTQKQVYDLVLAHINEGGTEHGPVIESVRKDLEAIYPDITTSDVNQALSQYGKTQLPSQEADKKLAREFKTLSRLERQLEDAINKIPPLKTGPQRDKATARVRELQKQVKDAMRKAGIEPRSEEDQLTSSLGAAKTRMRNEIEEMAKAIETKTPRTENKSKLEYDAEAKDLKGKLDAKRAEYEAIFGKNEKTIEERQAEALKNLDKSIAEEDAMLQEGKLKRDKKGNPLPETPEMARKKAELAAMRKLRSELLRESLPKKDPSQAALDRAIKAAEDSIARYDEMLRTGDLDPKKGPSKVPPSDKLETLQSIRDAMREAVRELRAEAKKGPKKSKEAKAEEASLKALEKRIAELDRRIRTEDFSKPAPRADLAGQSARVRQQRAERDAMVKLLRDLEKAKRLPKDEATIARERLAADKKRIRTANEKLKERIKKGDYEPRKRREPEMDQEKIDLLYEKQQIQRDFNEGLIESKRSKRSLGRKIFDAGTESLNLVRQVLTSGDLPPILRQGLFTLANPTVSAPAVARSFNAMFSGKRRFAEDLKIKNNPDHRLAEVSGLNLPNAETTSLAKQEEEHAGRFFRELPRWTVLGPLLRMSERSYNTFISSIRMDLFSKMLKAYGVDKTDLATTKRVADIINTITGRASLPGKKLEQAAPALNLALFATRYTMSRFKVAIGEPLWTGNATTRKFALEQYGRLLAGAAAIYGIANLFGAEVEKDPRSANFGKINIGNDAYLDPMAGLTQVTTLMARLITGETKTSKSGELVPLRETMRPLQTVAPHLAAKGKPNMLIGDTTDILKQFARTKLAPVPGEIVNLLAGQDLSGQPARFSGKVGGVEVPGGGTLSRVGAPISFQDILKTMERQGVPKGAAAWILSLFGAGLQQRNKQEKTGGMRLSL